MTFQHETVLLNELVDSLNLTPGACVIDATAGGGGHSQLILNRIGSEGFLILFDKDPLACAYLKDKFQKEIAKDQVHVIHGSFSAIDQIVSLTETSARIKERGIAAICADLGVSSPQIDTALRGFSFQLDGPLDMRMNQDVADLDAKTVVNTYGLYELRKIFQELGEDPKAHILANAIIKRREKKPFTTTKDLADFVAQSLHYKEKSRKHPATRVFQALRIHVNNELYDIETFLDQAFQLLKPAGRLAVISFHSLEDRIIKQAFKRFCGETDKVLLKLPVRENPSAKKTATIIKPFPSYPSEEEIERNPRSRSAKLRVLEKS